MKEIELVIHRSSPLFMKWFDCQIDTLMGILQLYPHGGTDSSDPFGTAMQGQEDTLLWLKLDQPCSYLRYRRREPDYMSSDADFSRHFPLVLEVPGLYTSAPGKSASPIMMLWSPAMVVTLEHEPRQTYLMIDYHIPEPDPLLRLLRVIAVKYEHTRDQLQRIDLEELISRASEFERAEWDKLGWVQRQTKESTQDSASLSVSTTDREKRHQARGMNIDTLPKVVKVLLLMHYRKLTQTYACQLVLVQRELEFCLG